MHLRIGYPDFILRPAELAERYADINVHPDYYFENMLSILRVCDFCCKYFYISLFCFRLQHLTRVEQSRLGTTVNKTLWNTQPAIVNAYYSRNKNQISEYKRIYLISILLFLRGQIMSSEYVLEMN